MTLGLDQIFIRLILSVILAGLFGIERELRHKKAGLRTNILVGLGSTLIMIVSLAFEMDSARIAAGVVTGIGFIGAGMIINDGQRGEVHGLTTAATIWIVSAIGLAVGIGYFSAAIAATLVGLVVLSLFGSKKVRDAVKLDD
ncbi:MgtC/SapB family protein [Candidatus Falkowbacteria bacterium]|nr:MgtC/SapB family protein [Candidatus Falkowbacteria bacterium]